MNEKIVIPYSGYVMLLVFFALIVIGVTGFAMEIIPLGLLGFFAGILLNCPWYRLVRISLTK